MSPFDNFFLLFLTGIISYYLMKSNYLKLSLYITNLLHYFFHFILNISFLSSFFQFILQFYYPFSSSSSSSFYCCLKSLFQNKKVILINKILIQILLNQENISLSSSSSSSASSSCCCSFDDYNSIPNNSNNSNNNNNNKIQLPTLVLDLDETLLHVTSDDKKRSPDYIVWDEDHRIYSKVYKRPYVELFLAIVSKYYEVVIFTSSYACYCDPLLETIKYSDIITKRFYNTSMTLISPDLYHYEKDLFLTTPSNMPNRLLLVDNNLETCTTYQENIYLIPSYSGQENDYCLIGLLFVLLSMNEMNDFRVLLSKRTKS